MLKRCRSLHSGERWCWRSRRAAGVMMVRKLRRQDHNWVFPGRAESGWRTANTKSIQDAAAAAGIKLKFSDAQQKQENQIKAIRSFIAQKVDLIAFSPVVESGWDTVLKEAKDAKIPVILTDRAVDSKDKSLYKTFIGSDFVLEGKKAGEWLVNEYKSAQAP